MWETWEAATGIARQKWRRDVSRALALLEASEDRAAQVALTALLSGPNVPHERAPEGRPLDAAG
jgi:hypothetical protein